MTAHPPPYRLHLDALRAIAPDLAEVLDTIARVHRLTLRAALDLDLAPACHDALDALRAGAEAAEEAMQGAV